MESKKKEPELVEACEDQSFIQKATEEIMVVLGEDFEETEDIQEFSIESFLDFLEDKKEITFNQWDEIAKRLPSSDKRKTSQIIKVWSDHTEIPLIRKGFPVWILSMDSDFKIQKVVISNNQNKISECSICYIPEDFGSFDFEVFGITVKAVKNQKANGPEEKNEIQNKSVKGSFVSESFEYRTARCLDSLYDSLFWMWNKEWTENLQDSIINLILAMDEEKIGDIFNGMKGMMENFAMRSFKSFDALTEMINDDCGSALDNNDFGSVCRLHQNLYQLVEINSMMPLPVKIIEAIKNFEVVKCQLVNGDPLKKSLFELKESCEEYLVSLDECKAEIYPNSLAMLLKSLASISSNVLINPSDLSPLWGLRAMQMMFSMMNPTSFQNKFITHSPVFPLKDLLKCDKRTDDFVSHFTEVLTGDTIMISSLMPYRLGFNIDENIEAITSILRSGMTYVCSDGSLIAALSTSRAALHLKGELKNKKIFKKSKDISRILRNVDKPLGDFSLAINTDFDAAIKGLRVHHENNWVDETTESVWRAMFQRKQMIIFELWYGGEMVAADFGHPVDFTFYVATRFHNHKYKKFQPGFILAFVSAKLLRDVFGFEIWDFGGIDLNPQMAYKDTLADVLNRVEFLKLFRNIRSNYKKKESNFVSGKIFGKITEHHVLTFKK